MGGSRAADAPPPGTTDWDRHPVGRDAELRHLAELLRQPTAPGLLLVGVPGVGKSCLGRAALALAAQQGQPTATVAATEALAAIPFGAVAHLLPGPQVAFTSRLDIFRYAVSAIRDRARGRRTVVLVDDAHRLDRSSAALLHHLVLAGGAFLVGTVPTGATIDDSLSSIWREGVGRVEVGPLVDTAVGEFAEAVLGGQVDGGTTHLLARLSGGNPLLLRELLRSGLDSASLCEVGGVWTMPRPPPVSDSLEQALRRFITSTDPRVREAGELVAFGEPLGLDLLCRLVPLDWVVRAETAGLVRMAPDGRRREVRLCHPLTGELLRAMTPPIRAVARRRELAQALAPTGLRRQGDALRRALWLADELTTAPAATLLAAAREAARLFDHALTVRFAAAANQVEPSAEASALQAPALVWLSRHDEAEQRFADLAAADPDLADRGDHAFVRIINLWLGLHRFAEAEAVLTRAEARATDPQLQAQLGAARALGLTTLGHIGRAVDECERWLPEATTLAARGHLVPVYVDALTHAGRTGSAITVSERLAPQWSEIADAYPYLRDGLALAHAIAIMLDGQLGAADELATERYDQAVANRDDHSRAGWAYVRGRVALYRGRLPDVLRWQREAVVLMTGSMPLAGARGLLGAYGDIVEVHAITGQVELARTTIVEAERHLSDGMVVPPIETARAWLLAAEGDRSGAQALLRDIADRSAEVGWYGLSLRVLHDLARLGAPHQAAPTLAAQAEKLGGDLPLRYAAHVRALADRSPHGLTAAAEAFVVADERLLAAEAFAAAAQLYHAAGQDPAARRDAERARALYGWCGDIQTPQPAPAESDLALTVRERELASLIAQGHTNRQIAERLSLSVRTVENHLHRVYAKLGLAGRADLAALGLVDAVRLPGS